ncbi:MAG: DUF5818 domain-containing protein [Sandaracinobacter sp.]
MPMGTRHTVTGELRWDDGNRIHRLEVGGGAFWFVDLPRRGWRMRGQRVTVEGTRSGFNLLDVDRIWTGDRPPPPRQSLAVRLAKIWA